MMKRSQIRSIVKRDAKRALSGSWGAAILIGLIIWLAGTLITMTANGEFGVLSSILSSGILRVAVMVLLVGPLELGAVAWYMKLLRGAEPTLANEFDCFRSTKAYGAGVMSYGFFALVGVGVTAAVMIMLAGAGVAVVIVSMALSIPISIHIPQLFVTPYWDGGNYFADIPLPYIIDALRAALGTIIVIAVVISALYFAVKIFLIRFSAIYNIMADDNGLPIGDAIKKSCAVMKGHTWDIVVFYLSFFGWYLLVPLTFGLILLYVGPYMKAAQTLYIEYFRDVENGTAFNYGAAQAYGNDAGV